MLNVRVACERCGTVTLPAADILVRRGDGAREPSLVFVCPGCSRPVVHVTDRRTAQLLVEAGTLPWPSAGEAEDPVQQFRADLAIPGALERYVAERPA